jgi:hypothetical protein
MYIYIYIYKIYIDILMLFVILKILTSFRFNLIFFLIIAVYSIAFVKYVKIFYLSLPYGYLFITQESKALILTIRTDLTIVINVIRA